MGRIARVIAVGVAHHVTQRGNGCRFLLESDADRRVYLDLLRENLASHEVLVGYCVMSSHVHLIVIPTDAEGLALSMKHTHGRYASYWNAVHNSSGHAWQGRYFSCPLDGPHLWEALRYTELNPVTHSVGEAQEVLGVSASFGRRSTVSVSWTHSFVDTVSCSFVDILSVPRLSPGSGSATGAMNLFDVDSVSEARILIRDLNRDLNRDRRTVCRRNDFFRA